MGLNSVLQNMSFTCQRGYWYCSQKMI